MKRAATTATVVTRAARTNSHTLTWSNWSRRGRACRPVSRNSAPSRMKMKRSKKDSAGAWRSV